MQQMQLGLMAKAVANCSEIIVSNIDKPAYRYATGSTI